jgi:hypothetical protein
MITINSLNEIKQWFEKNGKMEFELPDGYFGRPGDNLDVLNSIFIETDALVIKLNITEASRKFIFYGEIDYEFVNGCLKISNFDSLIFEWERVGETELSVKEYNSGLIRFIPHSKYIPQGWKP